MIFLWLLPLYVAVEVCFYVAYHWYLVPFSNRMRKEPPPYRDYGNDRWKLVDRIIQRIKNRKKYNNKTNSNTTRLSSNDDDDDVKEEMIKFLTGWFQVSTKTEETGGGVIVTGNTLDDEDAEEDDDDYDNDPAIPQVTTREEEEAAPVMKLVDTYSNGTENCYINLEEKIDGNDDDSDDGNGNGNGNKTSCEKKIEKTTTAAAAAAAGVDEDDAKIQHEQEKKKEVTKTTTATMIRNKNNNNNKKKKSISTAYNAATTATATLSKKDVDDFFTWAFFGKNFPELLLWEQIELKKIYTELFKETGVSFRDDIDHSTLYYHYDDKNGILIDDTTPTNTAITTDTDIDTDIDNTDTDNNNSIKDKGKEKKKTECYYKHGKPRRMTLEPTTARHRPLLVYVIVAVLKFLAGIFLRLHGFRRHRSKYGLVCWYRCPHRRYSENEAAEKIKHDNNNNNNGNNKDSYLPMLFFHGIAPCGHVFYLPMILKGLAETPSSKRPIFIFENKTISCSIDLNPLTEDETVDGVIEVLGKMTNYFDERNNNNDNHDSLLSLVGHSFGSCPIVWLLADPRIRTKIRQVTLLDPVAILLSEPDVMANFLYAGECTLYNPIHIMASSELFTQLYIRRYFAWYNSELWLDGLPSETKVLVCLSSNDAIVNTGKVTDELMRMRFDNVNNLLVWKDARHGACITSPKKWKEIKERMIRHEQQILQQQQQQQQQ